MIDLKNRKVCVLIVSYNFEPWIDKCLPSVYASTLPVTIVVVDNNSKDNTTDIIKSKYTQVILFEKSENLGFGKANNVGFEYALTNGFDYVFLLNQDAWIEKDMLEKLITSSQASSQLVEVPFVNAAFWLLPIAVIKKIGGFSPLFYHYGEDRNYIQRNVYHGYKIGYVPSAFATHDRQNREVPNHVFLYAEYVYFLSELANINYYLPKAIAYSVLAPIKKMFIEGYGGRTYNSGAYLKMAFLLIGKIPAACETRKKTKSIGPHYL